MIYKHNYLTKNEGTKEELMTLYRTAEKILDSREITYGMSDISKKLFFLYDIDEFCSIRKRNAIVLMELLSNIKNIELPFEKVKK